MVWHYNNYKRQNAGKTLTLSIIIISERAKRASASGNVILFISMSPEVICEENYEGAKRPSWGVPLPGQGHFCISSPKTKVSDAVCGGLFAVGGEIWTHRSRTRSAESARPFRVILDSVGYH